MVTLSSRYYNQVSKASPSQQTNQYKTPTSVMRNARESYLIYLGFKLQCFLNADKLFSATHFPHSLVTLFHNL